MDSEAPVYDSVQLVNIAPITMVKTVLITIVTGAFVNQRSHHWGGPHQSIGIYTPSSCAAAGSDEGPGCEPL